MEFKEYKLEDITSRIGDGIHGTPIYDINGQYYFINGNNLVNGKILIKDDTKKINEMEYYKYKRELFDRTLLLSINGTIGNVAIYNNEKCILGKSACYINVLPKFNVNYIKYLLMSDYSQNYMITAANGTTIKNVPLSAVRNFCIKLPSLENQNKIAKILSSLDSKIEINNNINNNLHELICNQYSSYLSNIKYKEKTIIYKVKELLSFDSGIEPGSKNYNTKKSKNDIEFYRVGDMLSKCNTFVNKSLIGSNILKETDVVVSFDATIGRVAYGLIGGFSTGMRRIRSNNDIVFIPSSFIYAYFNDKETLNIINENARGTTILHAGTSINFLKIKINKQYFKELIDIINPIFERMLQIKKENVTLSQLRDTLLQKLMNGKIELENIEI